MATLKELRERAADRPGLKKASGDPTAWSKQWARDAYALAVEEGGGSSEVGRREDKHESTIRARSHDDRKDPTLAQCVAGLGSNGLKALAEELLKKAEEFAVSELREKAARRRVG